MVLEIEEILKRAENKGMTAEELFAKANVAPITLWRYRKNKYNPRLETLRKLMDALNG